MCVNTPVMSEAGSAVRVQLPSPFPITNLLRRTKGCRFVKTTLVSGVKLASLVSAQLPGPLPIPALLDPGVRVRERVSEKESERETKCERERVKE